MKNLVKNKRAEGFTIIEVMIVLAIAGLIMVIVFLAVPQLQRNQRDNARQNVVNRTLSEMQTFAGNNGGAYPVDGAAGCPEGAAARATNFLTNYWGAANFSHNNPRDGNNYQFCVAAALGTNPTADQIMVVRDAVCSGETAVNVAGGNQANTTTRSVAVRVLLDNGTSYYCASNGS